MAGQRLTTLIDVTDTGFTANLRAGFASLGLKSEAQLKTVAIEVTNRAREFCPVATGRLRASIADGPVEHERAGPYVMVGTDTIYAPYIEHGTWKMKAQPFLRPALAEASHGDFKMVTGTAAT